MEYFLTRDYQQHSSCLVIAFTSLGKFIAYNTDITASDRDRGYLVWGHIRLSH